MKQDIIDDFDRPKGTYLRGGSVVILAVDGNGTSWHPHDTTPMNATRTMNSV